MNRCYNLQHINQCLIESFTAKFSMTLHLVFGVGNHYDQYIQNTNEKYHQRLLTQTESSQVSVGTLKPCLYPC